MNKSFDYFLNKVKSENKVNEDHDHWMVGTIPSPTEWEKVQLSNIIGHETYKIKLVDNYYVMPAGKIDWFKDNVGKTIKFKYDKKSREIMRVEIVNTNPPMPNEDNPTNVTNEALMASDVKNILLKYTKFLYDGGAFQTGLDNDIHREDIVNKFLNP